LTIRNLVRTTRPLLAGSAIRFEMTKSKFATQFADRLEAALGPIQETAPS
jgi:hypothetical protein